MTWTYSGNPATTPTDEVRFWLQDTVITRPLMQNEEIEFAIDRYAALYGGSNVMVASYLAGVLAARFAGEVAISADGVSIATENLQKQYAQLAVDLRNQYLNETGQGVTPYVGGIERFEVPDFSVKSGQFGIGMDDNMRAGKQNYGERGEIPDSWGEFGGDWW